MFVKRRLSSPTSSFKNAVQQAYRAVKLVICRKDLPENPRWREQGYPYANCWEIDELFSEAARTGRDSELYREARRIYWESYWRLLRKYKGRHPFFEAYEVVGSTLRPVEDREEWILKNIIVSAFANGIVPPEAREQAVKLYRELYGPVAAGR